MSGLIRWALHQPFEMTPWAYLMCAPETHQLRSEPHLLVPSAVSSQLYSMPRLPCSSLCGMRNTILHRRGVVAIFLRQSP